jgi:hypothetical protein
MPKKPDYEELEKRICEISYFMQAKEGFASLFYFLIAHAEWLWRKKNADIFAEISM